MHFLQKYFGSNFCQLLLSYKLCVNRFLTRGFCLVVWVNMMTLLPKTSFSVMAYGGGTLFPSIVKNTPQHALLLRLKQLLAVVD